MSIMDFDDMLDEIGEIGKFQIRILILLCFPVLFAASAVFRYIFTAGVPNYRCYVPSCDNSTHPTYNEDWLEYAIPKDSSHDFEYKPDQCLMYQPIKDFGCNKGDFTNKTIGCDQWVFDIERTIVNDFNITCAGSEWKLTLVGTLHFTGIIVGAFIYGMLSDKFGRKNIFLLCVAIMSTSGAVQSLSPNYITFIVLQFISASGTSSIYPLAFILGVEMVGKNKRMVMVTILNYFYSIGQAMVGLIAWLAQDWVKIQLITSLPCIIFISYYWLVPESVRWLLSQNKQAMAKTVVCKLAKENKVELSDYLLNSFNKSGHNAISEKSEDISIWGMFKSMSKSRVLVVRYIIIIFVWIVSAFVFYGLSVNSTSLSGNKYLNFSLTCLIEIPGYTLAWLCIERFGRKSSLIGSLFLCALTCGLSIAIPENLTWVSISLHLLGKLGISFSFGVIFVYTAELLPTSVRGGGVGIACTFSKIGVMMAPFVPLAGAYVNFLPMLLFTITAILAGLISFKLPETLGHKLPETVKEAENIGRR